MRTGCGSPGALVAGAAAMRPHVAVAAAEVALGVLGGERRLGHLRCVGVVFAPVLSVDNMLVKSLNHNYGWHFIMINLLIRFAIFMIFIVLIYMSIISSMFTIAYLDGITFLITAHEITSINQYLLSEHMDSIYQQVVVI